MDFSKITAQEVLGMIQSGTSGDNGLILKWDYFDTYTLGSDLEYDFFQIPQGQGTPQKRPWDTNNRLAGVIPAVQKMFVTSIGLGIIAIAALTPEQQKDLFTWISSSFFAFDIQNKANVLELTGEKLIGSDILLAGDNTVNGNYLPITNNPHFYEISNKLENSIQLAGNTPFKICASWASVPDSIQDVIKLRVTLRGILVRPT